MAKKSDPVFFLYPCCLPLAAGPVATLGRFIRVFVSVSDNPPLRFGIHTCTE